MRLFRKVWNVGKAKPLPSTEGATEELSIVTGAVRLANGRWIRTPGGCVAGVILSDGSLVQCEGEPPVAKGKGWFKGGATGRRPRPAPGIGQGALQQQRQW